MVYLEHFGLHAAPFRIIPDTDFFFAGAKRGATLDALLYAIICDEGIVKVTGEVGSGKTMLCRMLLERLPEQVETVYLANPMLARDEILLAIADELAITLPEGRNHLLLRALHERLLEIFASGRQMVALIDEAHAMSAEALEEIRQLSNLESNQHKLLQIVLFGQPELDQRLQEPAMRQLNERIAHHFRLQPLQTRDVAAYLMFRLHAAGYRGPDLFTPRAVRLLSRVSQGLTRRINLLADKAMLAAYASGKHEIGRRELESAVRDAQFASLRAPWFSGWRRPAAAACGVAMIVAAYLAGSRQVLAPVMGPVQMGPAQTAGPAAASTPLTTSGPQETQWPESAPPAADSSAFKGSSSAQSKSRNRHADSTEALARLIATTEQWLYNTPDDHYFIQLLVTDGNNQREVLEFVERQRAALDPGQIRVYRSRATGKERLGVIYGDYVSRDQASMALAALGEIDSTRKPYLREVRKLRPARSLAGPDEQEARQ